MRLLRLIPFVFALVSAACTPTYPTPPDPTIVAVQVFYARPMSAALTGSSYEFTAYSVRSDGVYEDVTRKATWSSSDPQVLQLCSWWWTAGTFVAVSAGRADVTARYQSVSGTLSIPVLLSDRLTYPRLLISGGDPHTVGKTDKIKVVLLDTSHPWGQEISSGVGWKIADPSIVRVEGMSVTALRVGTATVKATITPSTIH
jgi:hypothetical protein